MPEHPLGSPERPLRVAVIGAGPSAFYTAEALFKRDDLHCRVDMFDRLPTPYGLVRGGVAPDHQKIKSVVKAYERIAGHDGFRFMGNVKIGRDLQVDDLMGHYDQVVFAVGNESARNLGIPGEDLAGVHSATEFVFWYNGHPDYRHLSFELAAAESVAVVGNGNVAMDVSRILIQDPDRLADSDIADHALEALRRSRIREVVLLGRRGPAQAAFSPKEIAEIAALDEVDVVVRPEEAEVDEVSRQWLENKAPKAAHKNLAFLAERAAAGEGDNERKLRCRFLVSPVEITGDGSVQGMRIRHAELQLDTSGTPRPKPVDRYEELDVQMVFKAIGYRGVAIPGVPFDDDWGLIPNDEGRVQQERGGDVVPGMYVVGWAKRGPTGLIGTNSPDARATVERMAEDLAGHAGTPPAGEVDELLRERGVDFVTWEDWRRYDSWEVEEGSRSGRVRRKLTSVDEIMEVIRRLRGA